MPQKTNLNISPYFDDYDKAKNFYKVLFKPGFPIQARELTTLQSILQNQVEEFGSHIFKEGSMVIPGGITYDPEYDAVKVNSLHLGLDITLYLDSIIQKGVNLRGRNSNIVASIKGYLLPSSGEVEDLTIFVKYLSSDDSNVSKAFPDSEVLLLEDNITYGNTTLNQSDSVITLLASNSTEIGSAVNIEEGVYFIRGTFARVEKDTIILSPYSNTTSYRVGLSVNESIVSSNEDPTLNDNAKGFTNYAAPGADRFKIETRLTKKSIDDTDDVNFIELIRIINGRILKVQNTSVYSEIKKYLAKRTYEESGDYTINPFKVIVNNSLDDGNSATPNGLYSALSITDNGNTPKEDLATVTVSPGTAYVKGFDVNLVGGASIDVKKPRTTQNVNKVSVPFKMGSLLKVNNVYGVPFINIGDVPNANPEDNIIQLFSQRRNTAVNNAGTGTRVGSARVYWFGLENNTYTDASTQWDLYLFDIQTYTQLQLTTTLTPADTPIGSFVRGLSSGSTGYIVEYTGGNQFPTLSQTTGSFLVGENIICNEDPSIIKTIEAVTEYGIEDVMSVYQNTNVINNGFNTDFIADTVLYDRLPKGFAATDVIAINAGTVTCSGKTFTAANGFKPGRIIKFSESQVDDITYNRINTVAADGSSFTLAAAFDVGGVSHGSVPTGVINVNFRFGVPNVLNYDSRGIYVPLPHQNISNVDLSGANLTITKQRLGATTNSLGSLVVTANELLDSQTGVTEVFFEPFDAERYAVIYSSGTPASLTSSQVTISADGKTLTIAGLLPNQNNVCVITTLRKTSITSKAKQFIRSATISVNKSKTDASDLTKSSAYGLRVEDNEISLNVPDVSNVLAIYESPNNNPPVLDKLKFITGFNLDSSTIAGEKIVGEDSGAVAQLVTANSPTEVSIVYLGGVEFTPGEQLKFQESNIVATPIQLIPGSYVNLTNNYILDKGHREQFSDYSRIVKKGIASPTRELLIVFNYYKVNSVSSGSSGDIFTANSYTTERYTYDIPEIGDSKVRSTDVLDFRPRVVEYSGSSSPFAFTEREFESTFNFVISPDEASIVGYDYYVGRLDRVVMDIFGEVKVLQGSPSDQPQLPKLESDTMEIAQIQYPPYLYNPSDVSIRLIDNRRYTMKDIGNIYNKVRTLEEVTSLSLLEVNTKITNVTDAFGMNRFKSGFVVSDFSNNNLINYDNSETNVDIDAFRSCLRSSIDFWSVEAELALNPGIDRSAADINANLKLLDESVKKTGDILTLDYTEVVMINQPHATRVENVNPFNVIAFVGGIKLDPPSDNWSRTVYTSKTRTESTGAVWNENATTKVQQWSEFSQGGKTETFYRRDTTTYNYKLSENNRQIDFVENVKVKSEKDIYMRERNVYFYGNGLKPFTKHYHSLDAQTIDILPKVVEIEMVNGIFQVGEVVEIISPTGNKIGRTLLQKPNHKFGGLGPTDTISAQLGESAVLTEKYTVDIYDTNRTAPGNSYSATSRIINFDVTKTAQSNDYFGYITPGCKIVGKTSNAIASATNTDLISDNWGDILGCMYFRNPQANPKPTRLVTTGTKTIKLSSNAPGTQVLPGSSFQSNAIGSFTGSGTVVSQDTSYVQLRNPPRPKDRPADVKLRSYAVHRDPLAQTFTTDDDGAYLTSFDVYFAKKDESAKLFVELRTVELGTPTNLLVQDYCQLEVNPEYINVPEDLNNPIPTNFKFESPVYLRPNTEYAIVFISPASDNYEMYIGRMGEKTVATSNLPDVENVVVSKQYIGGSLFKSQNGTIWTPSQFEDLTFTLYKAKFVKNGTVYFYNTPILPDGNNGASLISNPIETYPRKVSVAVTNTSTLGAILTPGTLVGETTTTITGRIEKTGSNLNGASLTILNPGSNYLNGTISGVELYSLDGNGSGATAQLNVSSGEITSISIVTPGTGYVEGERLGIVTSSVDGFGSGAFFSVDNLASPIETLYLTDLSENKFTLGNTLTYYVGATETTTVGTVVSDSAVLSPLYTGNVFKVTQYNHGHHTSTNKVKILNVSPSRESSSIAQDFGLNDTVISVANTTPFASFEGISTSRGYALIENEVVEYNSIGNGTITINSRGVDGTTSNTHASGTKIVPYEINGVSLTRINNDFTVSTINDFSSLDNYYLEFDRSDRNGGNMLNFSTQSSVGGDTAKISQNRQFSVIKPEFNSIAPTGTTINSSIRTITARSAGGIEAPFIDSGFENVDLNNTLSFNAPRMVASQVNETEYLDSLPSNKSLTLRVDMSTENENISPALDIKNAVFVLGRNRLNNPIADYTNSTSILNGTDDPHASIFVSKKVSLAKPATGIKVILSANRSEESDFRVLYRVDSANSSEINKKYVLFPGYNNLLDTDGDGFGDEVIDTSKNSGLADAFVEANSNSETFNEYTFTADNLDEFNSFVIKIVFSSKNESYPVLIRDFRAIALS